MGDDSLLKDFEESDDAGHRKLVQDLVSLLSEARVYACHDFKNEKYAAPKIALYNKLNNLAANVKEGMYDN